MNRVLYASDCLHVLNDPKALPNGSVDLIYLDPPFNSNSTYNLPFKSRDRSLKPVEAFEDTWRWRADDDERLSELERNPKTRPLATIVKFAQGLESGRGKISLAAYLLNMAQRLYAMKRVLKETGSIYLHCDPTASHYLKLLMDAIFGRKNFRNEIVWKRTSSHNDAKRLGNIHDVLLCFGKSKQSTSNTIFLPYEDKYIKSAFRYQDKDGRRYSSADLTATSKQGGGYEYEWRGVSRLWLCPISTMQRLENENRLHYSKSGLVRRKRYLDEAKGRPIADVWTDINPISSHAGERLGYPTQKPLALMERIIKASSNLGDTVLDPFCGCGTTAHAAESLGRKWIGIDISRFSTGLVKRRIVDRFGNLNRDDIEIHGTPESPAEARDLAQRDKFEFEKWVCGAMGANGMYKNPGEPGADGGVDGVVELPVIRQKGSKFESQTEYVIIQVKGGAGSAGLGQSAERNGAAAGRDCWHHGLLSRADGHGREPAQQRAMGGRLPAVPRDSRLQH